LLRRSHHTICTLKSHTEKLKQGYKIDYYVSYIFGGIIQEADGRFCPTNDLIEVVSKQVLLDKSQEIETPIRPSKSTTQADEVTVNLIEDEGSLRPLPRRDHTAVMIKNNQYMLIYGGKNDLAFQYKENDLQNYDNLSSQRPIKKLLYNEISSSSLDDIMLYSI